MFCVALDVSAHRQVLKLRSIVVLLRQGDVIRELASGALCVFSLFFTEDDYPIPRNAGN